MNSPTDDPLFEFAYFWLPHRVVCSRICGTPVSSGGFVLKPIEKTLLLSSRAMCRCSAPVLSCCKCKAVNSSSGTCFDRRRVKPWSFSPGFGYWESSVTARRAAPLVALRSIVLAAVLRKPECWQKSLVLCKATGNGDGDGGGGDDTRYLRRPVLAAVGTGADAELGLPATLQRQWVPQVVTDLTPAAVCRPSAHTHPSCPPSSEGIKWNERKPGGKPATEPCFGRVGNSGAEATTGAGGCTCARGG